VSFSWFSGLDVQVFDAILAEPGVPEVVKVFTIEQITKSTCQIVTQPVNLFYLCRLL
jgi:hypothetical protein